MIIFTYSHLHFLLLILLVDLQSSILFCIYCFGNINVSWEKLTLFFNPFLFYYLNLLNTIKKIICIIIVYYSQYISEHCFKGWKNIKIWT